MRKGRKFVARKEVESGESAKIAPTVAVRRPGEAGVVVAKVLAIEEVRGTIGEGDIILGEALTGDVR